MKRTIHAALSIIILLSALDGTAQSKKSAKAYEIFEAGEYHLAIDEFKDAYEKTMSKSDKLDVAFNIAECYRRNTFLCTVRFHNDHRSAYG